MDIIKQLIEKKEEHLKQINAINTLLESYGHVLNETPANVVNDNVSKHKKGRRFPKGATYLAQIEFIFEQENRFLHNTEISNVIAKHENIKDISWLKKRLSAVLSKAKKENDLENLVNYKFGKATKDTVWGFSDWMDSKGNIKKNYMYSEKIG